MPRELLEDARDVCQLSMFSAEDFPVSLTLSPVAALPPQTSAISGLSSTDSFASLNPDGSWRKTCQGYSQVTLDGSLETFCETWPRAGMTRNGTAYLRPPLAPLTDGIASGLWPTPDASVMNLHESPESVLKRREIQRVRDVNGNGFGLRLTTAAQMWPTPCAEDAKNVPYQKGKSGQRYPMLLGAIRSEKMWPTPRAEHDSGKHRGSLDTLHSAIKDAHPSGQLNPTWVEWLMGYPLEWTACAAWATRSSRKLPNGSPGRSSPPKDGDHG